LFVAVPNAIHSRATIKLNLNDFLILSRNQWWQINTWLQHVAPLHDHLANLHWTSGTAAGK
jgi:hypothetical protein